MYNHNCRSSCYMNNLADMFKITLFKIGRGDRYNTNKVFHSGKTYVFFQKPWNFELLLAIYNRRAIK